MMADINKYRLFKMEKTRVPKGEKYWFINSFGYIMVTDDEYLPANNRHYILGNYFHTEEEAELMARKLRAVLKGADVIETPSEEACEDAMKTSVTESILCVAPYESFTCKATDLLECAWLKGAE